MVPPIYVTRDTYRPVPVISQRLFRHFKNRARGHSVLKATNGTYTTVDYPTSDDIDAAAIAYIGGHVYTVSTAEATALNSAGYTTT